MILYGFGCFISLAVGVLATLFLASNISEIFLSETMSSDKVFLILFLSLMSFFMPIGQRMFALIVNHKLYKFSSRYASASVDNYTRTAPLDVPDLLSSLTNELGRAQGIFGNTVAQLISSLALFVAAIIYMAAKGNESFFALILSLCVIGVFLFLIQRKAIIKIGCSNRYFHGKTTTYASALVSRLECFKANDFSDSFVQEYSTSLKKWLKSILNLWFLAALSKYAIEAFAIVLFLFSYFYIGSGDTIEAFVVLLRLLPGVQSALRLGSGYTSNISLFRKFLGGAGKIIENKNDKAVFGEIEAFSLPDSKHLFSEVGVLFLSGDSGVGKSTYLKTMVLNTADSIYLSNEMLDVAILEFLIFKYKDSISNVLDSNEDLKQLINFDFDRIDSLSNGQKQRLLLLVAVVMEEKNIILDEVLTGLDPRNLEIAASVLKSMGGNKKIILVEHSKTLLKCLRNICPNECDEIFLNGGAA